MNHLFVFAVCLSAHFSIVASSGPESAASAEACSGHEGSPDDLAGCVGDMEVSLVQTSFTVHEKAAATKVHDWMAERSRQSAQKTSVTADTADLYWAQLGAQTHARARVLLQQAYGRTGSAAVGILILLIVLGVCLIVLLMATTRPANQEWTTLTPAKDLLNKPGASVQDPRLPGQFQAAPPALPPPTKEPSEVTPAPGGIGGFLSSLGIDTSGNMAQAPKTSSDKAPMYMMPAMLVQEPEGAQFFIDGVLTSDEQNGFAEVWRAAADRDHRKVFKIMFCEGQKGQQCDQKGVTVELAGNMPAAFLNTSFATHPPSGAQAYFSRNRHITMFDILSTGHLDLTSPYAIIERDAARGITVRRMSGEVICIVASGGYNTDFGNVVDEDGRLIATLSTRGHSLTGLGMVRGEWTQNRRVVQIAQGVDVMMIVCAVISATKLA